MKRIVTVLVLCAGLLSAQQADAQRVKVNTNQSQQPSWGPKGYNYVSYYYLPDMNAYYYVPDKQFIYQENGNWVFSKQLPQTYRNHNLNSTRKVVINDPKPYANHQYYASRYNGAASSNRQVAVRNVRNEQWRSQGNSNARNNDAIRQQRRREDWNRNDDSEKIKRSKKHPGRGNAYGHYK